MVVLNRKVAVIGIDYQQKNGIQRLIHKLRSSMRDPNLVFTNCSSSGWDIYHRILQLKVDKIIILDQFEDETESNINYLTINDSILIVGINPKFFKDKISPDLKKDWEQIIFQIKRLILKEISLDSIAQF